MAEEQDQAVTTNPQQGQQFQVQVALDDRDMRTIYTNFCRIQPAEQEVIMDLIFAMPNPNPAPNVPQGTPQVLWKTTDRVIMSWPTTKRLVNQLQQLIKRFEQQFGEIPVQPAARK